MIQQTVGRDIVGSRQADRKGDDYRNDRAERGDVQGFNQGFMHTLRIMRKRDRPHPAQQIGHLLGRVEQKLRDHLDRPDRDDHRRDYCQIDGKTRQPLHRRKTAPLAGLDCAGTHALLLVHAGAFDENRAHLVGDDLAGEDQQNDRQQHCADKIVIEALEGGEQGTADAAGADDADHG